MDLEKWLAGLGLERLLPLLRDAEVTEDVLADLTEADLEKLGIPLGPRKKLLKAIAGLGAAPAFAEAPAPAFAPARPREAERRQLTVMFVDLVGSTALSKRLDPEDMGQILKAYQNAVVGEISRLDGFTAKLMGDGVLAYFGWPKAHEDEAERAVRAGLAIVAAVAKLIGGGEALACRVGIATGLVVVGDLIGEGASQEEAVVGDTPNLAARLQALAEPGQVVVAEATRRLLGTGFTIEPLGVQAFKGVAEPVLAFRVTGERAVESRFASRSGETVMPMVGRDEELALLRRQWREAVAGEGRAVLIVGEAGIGKSRLIRALREAVLPDRPTVLLYQCSPFHADSPLWPVTQQLAFAARFEPGDDALTRRAKLAQVVAEGERLDLLASLLGIHADPDPLEKLDPQERRRRTLQALVEQLQDLSASAPVLVLMEDVHWVDPSTIELLQRTLEAIASLPVLMVLTSRPEAEPKLGNFPHLSRLVLSRLGRAAVEAIVGRLLEARAMDAAIRAQILAKTDGVPLFVEELTKAVLDQAPAGLGVTVPSTLQDSLLARLDRDPAMKSVAQLAACIGRELDHALLSAVADLTADELGRGLDALVAAELVYRRGTPPDASYSFKHALVRDAAYESLLKSRRREVHGRIVKALEAKPEQAHELLAHHAAEAGEIDKAARSLFQAGQDAADRSANHEALAIFQRGLAQLVTLSNDPKRQRLELDYQLAIGRAVQLVIGRGCDEAALANARATELCESLGEDQLQYSVLYTSYVVEIYRSNIYKCLDITKRLLENTRKSGNPGSLAHALSARGISLLHSADLGGAAANFREFLRLAESGACVFDPRISMWDQDANVKLHMAHTVAHLGFLDQATMWLEAARERAVGSDNRNTIAWVAMFNVQVAAETRRKSDVIAASEIARIEILRSRVGALRQTVDIVETWARDDLSEARLAEAGAIMDAVRGGLPINSSILDYCFVEMLLARGRFQPALSLLEDRIVRAEENRHHLRLGELYRLRGEAIRPLSREGTEAQLYFNRAIDLARSQAARLIELRASTSLARLWAELGERQRAQDLLAPIYAWFTEGFDAPDLVEARALLGELR